MLKKWMNRSTRRKNMVLLVILCLVMELFTPFCQKTASADGENTYQIFYYSERGDLLSNGEQGDNPPTYTVDVGVPRLYPPLSYSSAYEFIGWYDSQSGGNPVANIPATARGNIQLFARYRLAEAVYVPPVHVPTTYYITYEFYDADGTRLSDVENPNPGYYYEDQTVSLSDASKYNCKFLGWYDAAEGGNPVSSVSGGSKTVYGRFSHKCTIKYELYGAENNGGNPDYFYSTETVILKDPPKKEGYKFLGWYNAMLGGNKVETVTGNDITVHARFERCVLINYELDGGTNNKNNPESFVPFKGDIILNEPTRKGFDFTGWYTAEKGGKKITSISSTQTKDITVYARWTPVPDLKGATVYLNHDQGLVYNATGQSVSLKKIVTKKGVVITNFKHCKVLGLTAREAGTHEVTVKGDGDRYTGKCTAKFKIAKARMLDAKIKLSQITYYFEPGVKKKPDVQFYLNGIRMHMKLDKDYTAKYDRDVIHAGKKSVVVRTTEDCNNLTIGEITVTYEVKKSNTKFTAKVSPSKISIRDLKHDVQKAQVTITGLTKGSEEVRFSINSVSDIDKKNYVTVDSESGRVILYPARWGECKIEIKCTSHANADRKKLEKYVSIVVE